MSFKKIAGISIFALSAGFIMPSADAVAGERVAWNHSVWGKSRAFTAGIEKLSELVKERSGGKFTIKVHYGGALSKGKENLDGIKLGAFQSAQFCDFYHPGKTPSFMVFSLPFLPVKGQDAVIKTREALFKHPALIADLDRWNAQVYISGLLPAYEFMGKDAPKTLADWKGKRVRAGGGIGAAMEVLGASRMTMPSPETYTSLSRGTIDAVSFGYTYAFGAYKIQEVSDWVTKGFTIGSFECPVVFNKTAYQKLPKEYQTIIEEAKAEVYEAQKAAYTDIDKVNEPIFEKKLEMIKYSQAELDKFIAVAGRPIWDKWVKDNQGKFDAQGVLDLLLKTAKQ